MSRTGLWDSHAHLDSDYFTSDRHELITNLQAELDGIVNPGCDVETSAFAVELAEKYDLPFFVVTDGASSTSNNGCEAVRRLLCKRVIRCKA